MATDFGKLILIPTPAAFLMANAGGLAMPRGVPPASRRTTIQLKLWPLSGGKRCHALQQIAVNPLKNAIKFTDNGPVRPAVPVQIAGMRMRRIAYNEPGRGDPGGKQHERRLNRS